MLTDLTNLAHSSSIKSQVLTSLSVGPIPLNSTPSFLPFFCSMYMADILLHFAHLLVLLQSDEYRWMDAGEMSLFAVDKVEAKAADSTVDLRHEGSPSQLPQDLR